MAVAMKHGQYPPHLGLSDYAEGVYPMVVAIHPCRYLKIKTT